MKKIISLFMFPLMALNVLAQEPGETLKPTVDLPVYFDISPPLRDMVKTYPAKVDKSWRDGAVKNYFDVKNDTAQPYIPDYMDPGLQTWKGPLTADTTLQNFAGLGNVNGTVPPDTEGDVGPNHYFQVVNCSYAIYNKTGNKIMGPYQSSSIFSGMPNNINSGDAIVLYDEQADRWIFSQFSLPSGNTNYIMIAVSQTPDPMGSWYRYQYSYNQLPDYPKFGVWPDGYYMTANRFTIAGQEYAGVGVYAFDRAAMLAGSATATRISFTLNAANEAFGVLPSDCDGEFPPMGTPNYFTYVTRTGTQHLGIYEFHANFANPTGSTFSNKINLNVTPFTYFTGTQGIPQLGSSRLLDPICDRLMNRVQYRVFNGHNSMVINHTVKNASGTAGIRWYELQKGTGAWSIYQQSTYAPNDNNSRWMASMAQDSAGNIALGFSISGTTTYPSIAYTGRLKNDPVNQMTIQERRIANGGGAQTGIWSSRSRWGDYSGMRIDPSNPTTFWYTQEYYQTTSEMNWATQIASFSFSDVFSSFASAYPAKVCAGDSSQLNVFPYGGSGNYTYSWSSNPPGFSSTLQNPKVGPDSTTVYYVSINDGTKLRTDSTSLIVVQRQSVFAGNDTLVNKYVDSVYLHGIAANYRLIGWVTSGDGTFENELSLITNYYPGAGDRAAMQVDVKLVALPVSPCTGNVISTRHISFDEFVGTGEQVKKGLVLSLQPNPARSYVTITIKGLQGTKAVLTLSDITGKMIYDESLAPNGKDLTKQLNLSGYPKGVYILQLKSDEQVKTERLVIN
ncbi:MAG: T9SS type A sorting domain-containing protein [Bacteroidales bacterium]|nr:T9SS type A sorting domain-containing protein [Bacteroidales bacterium]